MVFPASPIKGHLIRIDAIDAGGAPAIVRLASVSDALLCHLDGAQWDPGIARLPELSYDFFGGAFQNAIAVPQAQFSVALEALAQWPTATFKQLRFADARVRVWSGVVGTAFAGFTLRFDGTLAAEPEIGGQIARFTARMDDRWLDAPLLSTYAGTGGIEGGEDLTGAAKPLVFGACRFVPGVLIDAVDNVYQVSAGPVAAISAVYDRLVSLGASAGNYASLAALLAASIPNGRWATCLAQGLVRLGAPADGKICFDVSGDNGGAGGFVRLPGAVIGRVAALAGGTVSASNLTALDTARPWPQSLVLTAQTTARQVIQQIADSVVAVAGVSWLGTMFVQPLGIGSAAGTLKTDGTATPMVAEVTQAPVAAPYWRLATQAEPTFVVHETSEIASEYVLRGAYSAARTYRIDDLVTVADGSSWVYVNATPSAGNAPPSLPSTSNTWWSLVAGNGATGVAGDNLAFNGDFATSDLTGWSRKFVFHASSRISVAQNPTDPAWPAAYGLELYRATGDSAELSIVNGPESWDTAGLNNGIPLEPGEELVVDLVSWTTNSSQGIFSDCILKRTADVSSIASIDCTTHLNCFKPFATTIQINPGQAYTPVRYSFKNTTGSRGRAFVRIYGPGQQNTYGYVWNLRIRRKTGADQLVDASIKAEKLVTDQGVNLAALVPGQFNSYLTASGSISLGEDQSSNFAQTASIVAGVNDYIAVNTSVTITGGVTNWGNIVRLMRSRNGVATALSSVCARANGSAGTVNITHEDASHGGGTIYYYLEAQTGLNEFNNPSMFGTGSLSMRKFFVK